MRCVSVVSYDKDTRNNYGLMVNKNTSGTSKFEMKDLPSEVARAVGRSEGRGDFSNLSSW